ncbi:MAG TPA: NHLP bacteriocin system secretion protein [Terriglobales bacterium]|nr:NHLP bacteriocin system secretion protein [Terriglobales bacterium]
MEKSIFRQVSLDRLSSPEQLDQLMRVTSPKGWVALTAVFLLLAGAVVWSCVGSIPTTAAGQGVIVRRGGVLNVVTRGGGLVLDLNVKVGDKIRANQIVATIGQPVLAEKINAMRQTLAEAQRQREHAMQIRTNSSKLQIDALDRQRANAELQIKELEDQEKLTTEQVAADDQLVEKGLITKQQAIGTKQKLISLRDGMASLRAQIKQFDAQKFSFESQPQQEDEEMQARISSLQRELAGAEKELNMAETVVSPYSGEVLEVKAHPGGTVSMGAPIFSIQPDVTNLELVAYLPSSQAKETKVGMEVQISPSLIKREEFGFMKGEVEYVSNYPATTAALMSNFENESLARVLSGSGPVTEVRVRLRGSSYTPSGFEWSTSKGPDILIRSGTICSLKVVTKRQKPISLMFPYIREKLGMS